MKVSSRVPQVCAALCSILLASCETSPTTAKPSAGRNHAAAPAAAKQERSGLGTGWGETRDSRVFDTAFRRATGSRPLATATIYYNDAQGIREMVGNMTPRFARPPLRSEAENLVTIELRDESGRLLPGIETDGRWLVIGEQGRRYSIVVRNRTDVRIEVVLSVDGLDVIDGRAASFRKRGYVIRPGGKVEVEGFRQSLDAVAAFRFSSVRNSYANRKYGDTRNVGVIGVAIFHEVGTDPLGWSDAEQRWRADPFPGSRFGSPPEPVPIPLPRGR
ncbi:MAG TPA: hypothetical protein VF551_06925 [Chthoniobacterales bacterium]|jgi:hypothetical protein